MEISKITLPSGVTYDIMDEVARAAMSAGLTMEVVDTLPTADSITMGCIYLVADKHSDANDIYDEWVTVTSGDSYIWEKLGNTDINLSNYSKVGHKHTVTSDVAVNDHVFTPEGTNSSSSVSFTGQETDDVLGSNTTFTNSSSVVTYGTDGVTESVLKSSVTATVPKHKHVGKYLTVSTPQTASAVTEITPAQDTFVKAYTGETKKLETTKIPNITDIGTLGLAASWGATVVGETLSFSWIPNTPTSVPTVGADITVATGALSETDATGENVMVGLGTASTGSALTGLGTVSTDVFAKTVSLGSAEETSDGALAYLESVDDDGTSSVQFATTNNTANAYTTLPGATAAAQTITVGTNDKVQAITHVGDGTAAAQTFTGTEVAISHTVTNNEVKTSEASE